MVNGSAVTSMLVGDEEEDGVATVPYSPVGNTDGVNGIVESENLFSTYHVCQICDMLTRTRTTAAVKCSLSLPSTSCSVPPVDIFYHFVVKCLEHLDDFPVRGNYGPPTAHSRSCVLKTEVE
ncbi:unnamed protein product [Taenia asiatica]|uniref:Uncharacterized protein n=1 Tax=Taenia asiatica TaxID=60517 RepID=A0A0R3WHB9_TAEAS|nr:unnamed protein product [Taenia asiatica]